ncbi:hypothetical protein [Promicromonospora sp. NPDC050262]|uniref:hypothetical protein n=1 Tax=Promicromonospora sp. NPDC050262 TaxID=3155036 RepID=UPI0033CB6D9A
MSKPIEIKLDAETSGAEAGASRVADALGNVEDALDQVTDAGKDNTRVLDDIADKSDDAADSLDKIGDAAKDAGREADTLDRDFTKALDNVADEARKAGDDIGDGVRDGTRRASDGLDDFKDEASGTAREGAASFTGEWDDVGDIVQETLANAFAGFGPVGAAAGIAAAVGFGVLYSKIREESEKSEERVDEMFDAFLESEGRYLGDSYVLEQMKAISKGTDDAITSVDALQAIASATGRDIKDVTYEYIAGTLDYDAALQDVQDQINANGGALTAEGRIFNKTSLEAIDALHKQRDEIGKGTDEWSRFNRIGGADLHKKIDVDDEGTARDTQRKINSIKGKDVPLHLYVPQASINAVYNTVAGIRLPALTVQVRYGQAAV